MLLTHVFLNVTETIVVEFLHLLMRTYQGAIQPRAQLGYQIPFLPTTELVESPTNILQNINLVKQDGLEDKERCSVLIRKKKLSLRFGRKIIATKIYWQKKNDMI